ncbi:unnamed protein product, partial [Iphiclides podalirius]
MSFPVNASTLTETQSNGELSSTYALEQQIVYSLVDISIAYRPHSDQVSGAVRGGCYVCTRCQCGSGGVVVVISRCVVARPASDARRGDAEGWWTRLRSAGWPPPIASVPLPASRS